MYYPNNVFTSFFIREQALFESCRPLLASIRALVEGRQHATREACADFVALHNAYITAFREWERPDAERLSNRLKNAIRVLMHQRLLVAPEDIALLVEFTKEIKILSDKLAQVANQVRFLTRCCIGFVFLC